MPFGLIGSEARKLKQRAAQQALLAQQASAVAPVETAVPPAQTRGGLIGGMSPLAQDVGRRGKRMPTVSREATKLSKQGMALPDPVRSVDDGGYSRANRKLDGMQTFGRVLSALGGDLEGFDKITASRWDKQDADYERQQMLEQRQRQRAEVVNLFGPAAGVAFDTNPEKFGDYVGSNYQAANVSGGDSRVFGNGRETFTAPKYTIDGGFAIEQGPGGMRVQGQRAPSYGEQNDAFTADTGRMNANETMRNNNLTNSLGRDRLTFDQGEATRKAAQEADGGAVFEGSQLATIYNKSMADLEEAKAFQSQLDTIAGASTQFMDVVKGDEWLQGAGIFNDLMQAGSTRTSEAKKLTDTIAPLIRRPGSGGNSDADVTMFKNSVVNVNNTPQSNKLATEQAVALQQRGQQYVNFLTRTIDPRDPQSKQKADAMWNLYKQENNLFDSQSGKVKTVPTFDDWLNVKMGKAPPANSFLGKRVQSAVSAIAPPQDDVSDLLEKYLQ